MAQGLCFTSLTVALILPCSQRWWERPQECCWDAGAGAECFASGGASACLLLQKLDVMAALKGSCSTVAESNWCSIFKETVHLLSYGQIHNLLKGDVASGSEDHGPKCGCSP